MILIVLSFIIAAIFRLPNLINLLIDPLLYLILSIMFIIIFKKIFSVYFFIWVLLLFATLSTISLIVVPKWLVKEPKKYTPVLIEFFGKHVNPFSVIFTFISILGLMWFFGKFVYNK